MGILTETAKKLAPTNAYRVNGELTQADITALLKRSLETSSYSNVQIEYTYIEAGPGRFDMPTFKARIIANDPKGEKIEDFAEAEEMSKTVQKMLEVAGHQVNSASVSYSSMKKEAVGNFSAMIPRDHRVTPINY
jgi:hypothetical protein